MRYLSLVEQASGMVGYLNVFLGGGMGAALRHRVDRLTLLLATGGFRVNTLFVNVAGSFVMGWLAGWFTWRGEQASQHLRLFLTTGIPGGFTTFSTFSLDAALLYERGQFGAAAGYVALSVALPLLGVVAGLAVSRSAFS